MSATEPMSADAMTQQRDQFVERLLKSTAGVFEIFSIYLGDRLGFYRMLAEGGPRTAGELAARTGTHARYVREWLEQQTVTGILEVEEAQADTQERCFRGAVLIVDERVGEAFTPTGNGGAPLSRHRDGDAPRHLAALCEGSRFPKCGNRAD